MPDETTAPETAAPDAVADAIDAAIRAVTVLGLDRDEAGDTAAFDRAIGFRRDMQETKRRWVAGEPARQQRARKAETAQAEG